MTSSGTTEGRSTRKIAAAGGLLAAAGVSVLLLTAFPSDVAADAGSSEALAALAARSPGARIGGIALKGKMRRARPAALARSAGPAGGPDSSASATPFATVMSAGAPAPLGEGPTTGLESLPPGGLVLPAAPGALAALPPGGIGSVPGPGGGGIIIGPGVPGGIPGGGGATMPTPTPTPTPVPTQPPTAAVPEPATWLTLILGFGAVGATMRRRPRIRRFA